MGWRIAAALLVFASGCRAVFGLDPPDHRQDPVDALLADSGRDGCVSMSTLVDTCTLQYAPGAVGISGTIVTFDSDTGVFSPNVTAMVSEIQTTTGAVIVVSADTLTVTSGTSLAVIGKKPVVFAARNSITVDGVIAVGAGARTCTAAPGEDGSGGAGGGAGGGFGGAGGAGGKGDSDGAIVANGGATSPAVVRPTGLLGGCAGGKGGNASGPGGVAGAGGGALGLVAPTITIGAAAVIAVPGHGGRGGNSVDGGGGGGGSGGMIVLDARAVAMSGKLAATGGGGGEGAGNNSGNDGADGLVSTARAAGGNGNANNGGDGGDGGAGTAPDGLASIQFLTSGGGGGGGGVGFIAIAGTPMLGAMALISPPYASWP